MLITGDSIALGDGDSQFVRLATLDGREFGWFRITQLAPANAPQKEQHNPLPERTISEDTTMQTPQPDMQTKAAQFSARVAQHFKNTGNWATAFHLAQGEDEAGAMAYRLNGISTEAVEETAPPVLNLSARTGESFDQLAQRCALEKGVSLRQAVHEVGKARPDLAAARG